MLPPALLHAIETAIADADGEAFRISETRPVSGGCISRNFRVGNGRRACFLKVARGAAGQFAAEADGLRALARCAALAVPRVVAQGGSGKEHFLILEWLDLAPHGDEGKLGEALAALHAITYPRYGWETGNYIGATPQDNTWETDWARFYGRHRLLPQLRLAAARGAPRLLALARPLLEGLPAFFAGHAPAPSLLHGDLWSGNKGFAGGRPCLFDPAVHAGDPECDLAMSELFGGFSADFYAGYWSVRPPDPGYPRRRPLYQLYQLYHVLNHFNLFGGGYARQAEEAIARLNRELENG